MNEKDSALISALVAIIVAFNKFMQCTTRESVIIFIAMYIVIDFILLNYTERKD